MAERRDVGGDGEGSGGDPTQRMMERIWESLTEIRVRLDQQPPVQPAAVVPPLPEEAVPVAPVSFTPRVEVPPVVPVQPAVPVRPVNREEITVLVEQFLRLQPPTYSGGPNPDTAEHWIHEIERVFAIMRCPQEDRVLLAAYQLRGFAQEWWRLKMQTVFTGRVEDTILWYAPYVVRDNTMMVEYFIRGLRPELQDAVIPLMCKTVEEAAQRVAVLERTVRARQGQSQAGGLGSGSFRLRNSSKEAEVEADIRVFRREVSNRVMVIDHRFQKNPSRVRQGSHRYLHLSDVIIVDSQDI
ncbi:hypothetical protein Taro_019303 [Colocasia esculenta]|uniref:Uncharacterized protein n=1 Tax=Colocasia esculenta TaxID=4460 RepID=A0A843UT30_COLES|nr:hypothetical protein [Colocasia esculenta]